MKLGQASPRPFYHEHPDTLELVTDVVDALPGRVLLAASPLFPGGGGQLPDRGLIRWSGGESAITGYEPDERGLWHLLSTPTKTVLGPVEVVVAGDFRRLMRRLHTATHVLNALVYQAFDGALVTGAQMNADGTARMDFDLPGADSDRVRRLVAPMNDAVAQDLAIRDSYVALEEARATHGLIRNRSVAPPPTPDGNIRVVEIAGLDRQACGGTHLASTGESPRIVILKIDNKGRHNRRIYIGLE